jgi:hypothetical protein
MLGDAIVYGFSLYVIERGAVWKARAALLKVRRLRQSYRYKAQLQRPSGIGTLASGTSRLPTYETN